MKAISPNKPRSIEQHAMAVKHRITRNLYRVFLKHDLLSKRERKMEKQLMGRFAE